MQSVGLLSLNRKSGMNLIFSVILVSFVVSLSVSPVLAQESSDDAETLEEVVVEAERQKGDGYLNEQDASSNLGLELEDANNPFPTSSVGEQIFEDQNVRETSDVARNVPGVFANKNWEFTQFTSRGYQVSNSNGFQRNGLEFDRYMGKAIANVAKVEFNQGPQSILGTGGAVSTPAGSVNFVTKKPLEVPLQVVKFQGDQIGRKKVSIDYNVPVSEVFQYRINASYEDSDEIWNFGEKEASFISGVAQYTFDDSKLTLDAEYHDQERTIYSGLPVPSGRSAEFADRFPIDRYIGLPGRQAEHESFITQLGWEKDFYNDLTLTFDGHYQYFFRDRKQLDFSLSDSDGDGIAETATLFPAAFGGNLSRWMRYNLRTTVKGDHEGSYFDHDWVLGYEFEDFHGDFSSFGIGGFGGDPGAFGPGNPLGQIDVFNPDFSNIDRSKLPDPEFVFDGADRKDINSVFVQDQLQGKGVLKGYTFVGGLRWDDFQSPGSLGSNSITDDHAVSPRLGVVYRPPSYRSISYYGNYSESFEPRNPTGDIPNPDPVRGVQREIGVKKRWNDGNLSLTASYYFTTKENRIVSPPSGPDEQIGEEESKGIEIDLRGKIDPQTTIAANYAYNQAEVTKDPSRVGEDLSGTSDNQASLWTKYSFEDKWEGIDFGGGFNFVEERNVTFGSTRLPDQLTVDLMASFQPTERFKAQFNVDNLFDQRYYTNQRESESVMPGDPLTISTNLSYRF